MIARIIATAGGVGYAPKAPGTVGSLVGWLIGYAVAAHLPFAWRLITWAVAVVVGVIVSASTERQLGTHDPSIVVIDEVVGMWMVFVMMPAIAGSLTWSFLAFVSFRVFDILKPPPLKWLERAPGGWGIVFDDLGAGLYTYAMMCVFQTLYALTPLRGAP